MTINLNRVTAKQVAKLVSELDSKGRFQVILELLHTLESGQLQELLEAVDQKYGEALLDEEESFEEEYKFEYKEISNNFYAYVRQRGNVQCNEYLGPMRFLPGKKYQLTHKLNNTIKTLAGLGLHRDGEQIYLRIQHLSPIDEVKSYLYYDKTQPFPRRPQEEGIEPLFSKKEWKIKCLGPIKGPEASLDEQEKTHSRTEAAQQPKKFAIKEGQDTYQEKTSSVARRSKPSQPEMPQKRKPQLIIQVKKNFIPQVITCLEQWEVLSQALPSNSQWKLMRSTDRLVLHNQAGEAIVDYNSASQVLTTQSASSLLSWLLEIMSAVANSKVVNRQQKSTASRWLPRLQCAPSKDSIELLAYLFYL